jgi:hypothetical protein
VRCASILLLCRNREREALLKQKTPETTFETAPAIETAIEALRAVIAADAVKA